VAELDFPLLRTAEDFAAGTAPPAIRDCQQQLQWAEHWVILFPLWLGAMPALLKAFFEQALRPGFAYAGAWARGLPRKLLAGRSARVVVTMGTPGLYYRWYYRAHGLKSLERNVLAFVGVSPVRATTLGMVETVPAARRAAWLARLKRTGAAAR
jgi:putative NADPH-quinone reductase